MTIDPAEAAGKELLGVHNTGELPPITLDMAFQSAYHQLYRGISVIIGHMDSPQWRNVLHGLTATTALTLERDLGRIVGSEDFATREARPGPLE